MEPLLLRITMIYDDRFSHSKRVQSMEMKLAVFFLPWKAKLNGIERK